MFQWANLVAVPSVCVFHSMPLLQAAITSSAVKPRLVFADKMPRKQQRRRLPQRTPACIH